MLTISSLSFRSFSISCLLLAGSLCFSGTILGDEKLAFKPDYSGGQAFSENLKTCTPGSFVVFNPICLNIIKAGVDMANQNQNKDSQGKILTQGEVDQGILGCKTIYQILGKDGGKCQYQIIDLMSKTKSNCTVSVDELSTMAENTKKVYGSEAGVDASTMLLPTATQQCTAMPMGQ